MVGEAGIGDPELLATAAQQAQGLGLFVRGLVGMDRGAANEAFSDFLAARTLTANQIEFMDLIIEALTEQGVVAVARLYESPFTDVAPRGLEELFETDDVVELLRVLDDVRARATAA
jgi:type I restriction enzyme R subunit